VVVSGRLIAVHVDADGLVYYTRRFDAVHREIHALGRSGDGDKKA